MLCFFIDSKKKNRKSLTLFVRLQWYRDKQLIESTPPVCCPLHQDQTDDFIFGLEFLDSIIRWQLTIMTTLASINFLYIYTTKSSTTFNTYVAWYCQVIVWTLTSEGLVSFGQQLVFAPPIWNETIVHLNIDTKYNPTAWGLRWKSNRKAQHPEMMTVAVAVAMKEHST